jgi:hypothetical protein
MKTPDFVRSGPPERIYGEWRHTSGNYVIQHCGHPTANYPYMILARQADGNARPIIASYGRGFRKLAWAQDAVRALVAGAQPIFNPDNKYWLMPVGSTQHQ